MPSVVEETQNDADLLNYVLEPGRKCLPRTIAGLFNIEEEELRGLIRRCDLEHTGAGEIQAESWLRYAQRNHVGLSDYGRKVATSRRDAANAPAAKPIDHGPQTEAGRQAQDFARAQAEQQASESAENWTLYVGLLATADRAPEQADTLLTLASELNRLGSVDADQQVVSEIVRLQAAVDAGHDRAEASRAAKIEHEKTQQRHKAELHESWKKMRAAESAATASGEARFTIQKMAMQSPEFFTRDGTLPKLRTE